VGHVARMGDRRHAYSFGDEPSGFIDPPEDSDRWWLIVNVEMNLRVLLIRLRTVTGGGQL